jgi:hypothetical protein
MTTETSTSKNKYDETDLSISVMSTIFSLFPGFILYFVVGSDIANEYVLVEPFVKVLVSIPAYFMLLFFGGGTVFLIISFIANTIPSKVTTKFKVLSAFVVSEEEKAKRKAKYDENKSTIHMGRSMFSLLTASTLIMLLICTFLLAVAVFTRKNEALGSTTLLKDAVIIWFLNIYTFALVYWGFDEWGPSARRRAVKYAGKSFSFPDKGNASKDNWKPNWIDYLFLSFQISTSFGNSSTSPVAIWTKIAIMFQALISLVSLAVFIGRAINIIPTT